MFKKILWTLIVIGSIILIGYIGWSVFQEIGTKQTEETIAEKDTEDDSKVEKPKKRKGVNPFGDAVSKDKLSRETVLEYIHYMSHQKVDAIAKWGFFEMTEERINWLHDAVSKYNDKIRLSKAEVAIINRWVEGDFSEIIYDHNFVHNEVSAERVAEDGGLARDILSPEAEKAYIENTTEMDEIRN